MDHCEEVLPAIRPCPWTSDGQEPIAMPTQRKVCAIFMNKRALIWIVGMLVLVCLTVKDFIPLLDEYRNNNVATQIRIVNHNATVKPPLTTLCVPWATTQFQAVADHLSRLSENRSATPTETYERLKNESWDIVDDILREKSSFHEFDVAISATIMKPLLLESDPDFSVLHANHSAWNEPLVDAVWYFLFCLRRFDAYMTFEKNQSSIWCFQNQLADKFLSDKTRIDNIYARMTSVLCDHLIIGTGQDSTDNKSACINYIFTTPTAILKRVDMLGLHFCFELSSIPGNSSGASLSAKNDYGRIRSALNSFEFCDFCLYFGTDVLSGSGDIGQGYIIYKTQPMEDDHIKETVITSYAVSMSVVETRDGLQCQRENNLALCTGKCVVTKALDYCRCLPFTFRQYLANPWKGPYCNSTYYRNCAVKPRMISQSCETECSTPCDYTSYEWHTSILGGNNAWKEFRLDFSTLPSTYVEFIITTKFSWEQFFNQIGASFNFYLGFSGLSIIACVIYFGELVFYKRRRSIAASMTTVESPKIDRSEMIEKSFVADLEQIRQETRGLAAFFNAQMQSEVASLRDELKSEIDNLTKLVEENQVSKAKESKFKAKKRNRRQVADPVSSNALEERRS